MKYPITFWGEMTNSRLDCFSTTGKKCQELIPQGRAIGRREAKTVV